MEKSPIIASPLIKIALPVVATAAAAVGLMMYGGGTQSRSTSRSSRKPKPVAAATAPVTATPTHDPLFAFSASTPVHTASNLSNRNTSQASREKLRKDTYPLRGHVTSRSSGALLDRLNQGAGLLGKLGLAAGQTCGSTFSSCNTTPNGACNVDSDCYPAVVSNVSATATGATTVDLVGTADKASLGYWAVYPGTNAGSTDAQNVVLGWIVSDTGSTVGHTYVAHFGNAAMTANTAKTIDFGYPLRAHRYVGIQILTAPSGSVGITELRYGMGGVLP